MSSTGHGRANQLYKQTAAGNRLIRQTQCPAQAKGRINQLYKQTAARNRLIRHKLCTAQAQGRASQLYKQTVAGNRLIRHKLFAYSSSVGLLFYALMFYQGPASILTPP